MERPKWRQLYNEKSKENLKKDEQISELQKQVAVLQSNVDEQTSLRNNEKTDLETKIGELRVNITNLEKEKSDILEQNKGLSEQLRAKELSRFASEYENLEKEYGEQQDLWFKLSLGATGLLTISILASIVAPLHPLLQNKLWYQEPGFYLLNLIFITLFIYALKQHSHLGNLRIDYANRKALAQSYQYIIEDEDETSAVRKEFLEKALGIFTSRAMLKIGGITPYESIVEKVFGGKDA